MEILLNKKEQWGKRIDFCAKQWKQNRLDSYKKYSDYLNDIFPSRYKKYNVNYFQSSMDVLLSSLTVRNPEIIFTTKNIDASRSDDCSLLQSGINYAAKQQNWAYQNELAIQDAIAFGVGWIKLRTFLEKGYVEKALYEDQKTFWEKLSTGAVKVYKNAIDIIKSGGKEDNFKQIELDFSPVVENVPYPDVWVDPDCRRDFKKARYVIHVLVKDESEIEDMDFLKNKEKISPTSTRNLEEYGIDIDPANLENKKVVLYEIHDYVENKLLFVNEGSKDILYEGKNHYTEIVEGSVFCPIKFRERLRGGFYPEGDFKYIEQATLEYSEIRHAEAMHRRKGSPKYLYNTGKVTEKELKKLQREGENILVGVNGDPTGAVIPAPVAQIDSSIMSIFPAQIKEEIRDQIPVSEYDRGSVATSRRITKYEVQAVTGGTMNRSGRRFEKVRKLWEDESFKYAKLLAIGMPKGMMVPQLDETGKTIYKKLTQKNLSGLEYDVDIDITSIIPQDRQRQENKGTVIYDRCILKAPQYHNVPAVLKQVYKMWGLTPVERFMNPKLLEQLKKDEANPPKAEPGMPTSQIDGQGDNVPDMSSLLGDNSGGGGQSGI